MIIAKVDVWKIVEGLYTAQGMKTMPFSSLIKNTITSTSPGIAVGAYAMGFDKGDPAAALMSKPVLNNAEEWCV